MDLEKSHCPKVTFPQWKTLVVYKTFVLKEEHYTMRKAIETVETQSKFQQH